MERIITILNGVKRQGIDQVIEFMRTSNYATASCYEHHKYEGGLVDHSLEVYDLMMERRGTLSEGSVAVCAFFHDLGKSEKKGLRLRGHHPKRSVAILDMCGFQLTDMERFAILHHHKKDGSYITHPLRHCLSSSDMTSTGRWKLAHPSSKEPALQQVSDAILYMFSKL